MHAAIISKDHIIASSLRASLHDAGFGTTILGDVSTVAELASGLDLLIFDLDSVERNVVASALEFRKLAPSVPVLAVNAGDSSEERSEAFRAGYDDTVSRSFSAEEIALRAQALVRRAAGNDHAILKFADVILNRVARTLTRSGTPIRLTEREFRTMEYLMRNPNRVISPEELCEQVWKFHFDPGSNVVQVFIMRLRKKIDENFPTKLVHTVSRAGYVLKDELDAISQKQGACRDFEEAAA